MLAPREVIEKLQEEYFRLLDVYLTQETFALQSLNRRPLNINIIQSNRDNDTNRYQHLITIYHLFDQYPLDDCIEGVLIEKMINGN